MTSRTLQTGIAVVVVLAVIAVFFLYNNFLPSSSSPSTPTMTDTTTESNNPPASQGGLVVQDEVVGTGATAGVGDRVAVQYVGRLQDGTIFDQSSAHKDIMPGCTEAGQFCFTLGAGQVIPGWDQGLQGMKVGGKRVLIVPPALAYGTRAVGPIPANSTLVFEVTLKKISPSLEGPSAQ